MTDSDLLLTIAEVAVAFAGFASLVSILGQRSSRDDPRVLGVRMRAMILFSLFTVGFSLFPLLLFRYGVAEASAWRVSSGFLAMVFAAVGSWIFYSVRRMQRAGVQQRRIVPLIAAVLFLGLGGGTILLLVNALFLGPTLLAGAYLTGLLVLLFLAGFAFSLIVFSFLPGTDSE